jgi:hypothetical protein
VVGQDETKAMVSCPFVVVVGHSALDSDDVRPLQS